MNFSLNHVKKTYRVWGNYPFLYKLACVVTFLGRENFLRKRTVEKLNLCKGDIVLDLACGTGLNFKFLENAVGENGKIIAFDYSQDMLNAAKNRAQQNKWRNIEFIQGDAAELHLNQKVDAAMSTLGVSAIPNHEKALEKTVNSLKPGGRIAILDASLPTGFLKIFNPLIAFIYKNWASWDYTKNIPETLKKLLPNAKIEKHNIGTMYILYAIR